MLLSQAGIEFLPNAIDGAACPSNHHSIRSMEYTQMQSALADLAPADQRNSCSRARRTSHFEFCHQLSAPHCRPGRAVHTVSHDHPGIIDQRSASRVVRCDSVGSLAKLARTPSPARPRSRLGQHAPLSCNARELQSVFDKPQSSAFMLT